MASQTTQWNQQHDEQCLRFRPPVMSTLFDWTFVISGITHGHKQTTHSLKAPCVLSTVTWCSHRYTVSLHQLLCIKKDTQTSLPSRTSSLSFICTAGCSTPLSLWEITHITVMSHALSGCTLSLRRHWNWAVRVPIFFSFPALGHIETLSGAQLSVKVRAYSHSAHGTLTAHPWVSHSGRSLQH